ncbi:MAG: response regulator, partial [Gemmatimonadetes bacterium]|nr:response regulator [Gemmatimonadota bacterium]
MPAHFQTRVLLLEDNTGDYLLVQAGLAHAAPGAYLLTRAESLADALTRLETETFDLILSDLSVRDSEGLLTVKAFVSQALALPLVVLTGLNDSRIGEAAILLGAQDYLVKDEVDGAMLARTLRYAIDRKRLELRLRDAN